MIMKKLLIAFLTVVMITTVVPGFDNEYSVINEVEAKTKIKLNKTKLTLVKGKSYTLKVIGNKKKIKWSTSNKKIATVNSKGKVTAKKKGVVTITAKIGSKKYKCKITVKNPIKLNKTKVTLVKGKSTALKVTGTKKKVTWSSSNKKVATVNSKGKVTAKKKGTVTITAKADGLTVKSKVTVKNPSKSIAVDMLSLDITSVTLKKGNTYKMNVTVFPLNATNKTLFYSSSNKNVVTVSSTGKVTAKKVGTATVTAKSSNGKTVKCKFTVKTPKIEVSSVTLNKSALSFNVGESQQLTATINPNNAADKSVEWQSTNTNVVTVSSTGKVTAKKVGTATILVVASNGMSATCKITVAEKTQQNIAISSISLDNTSVTLEEGKIKTLNVSFAPTNATEQSITWSSSNENVATVSSRGRITAEKSGRAIITAKTNNGKIATCTVNVIRTTVVEGKPIYDYDIEFLNEHGFYSGLNIVTHVKTNNPFNWYIFNDLEPYLSVCVYDLDGKFVDTFANRLDYADIHFDTENYGWSERKVKDGFLIAGSIKKPGTYNIVVEEKIPNTTRTIQVCSKQVTVLDYEKEEDKYLDTLIESVKDEKTDYDKLRELEHIIQLKDYKYVANANLLKKGAYTSPYWIQKELDCISAASLMMKLADKFGYKNGYVFVGKFGIGASGHHQALIDVNRDDYFTTTHDEEVNKEYGLVSIKNYSDLDSNEVFDATPLIKANSTEDYTNIKYIDTNW